MARIRTIKPEFFTSEDIVTLTPLARLLYIALWCEADREGRLKWKPVTFKMRYLPKDDIDIEKIGGELIERRHVLLYGDGLAWLPKFKDHQYINPREAASVLPSPPVDSVDNSRVIDATARVSDTHVGKEGKEGKGNEHASGTRESVESEDKPKVNGAWWKTHAGIDAKGIELGVKPMRGEEYPAYTSRLFEVINERKKAIQT